MDGRLTLKHYVPYCTPIGQKAPNMLKPKVLHEVLKQANTNGVKASVLLNSEGSLLASAGEDATVLSAIFANIWSAYEKAGDLEFLMTDSQDGRVILTRITDSLILLLFGDTTAQFGMLKHKATLLRDYLEQPLRGLMD